MSEGFSTTSTSGSTYPTAAMESRPPHHDVNTGGNGAGNSTTGAAKEQAGEVAQTAQQAGTQVAGTAKEQAGAVTAEATHQARQLLSQVQGEISDQASTQQQRVAGGLHSLADELQSLIDGQPQEGIARDVARTASDKVQEIADWLDRRDPGSLLEEVRAYARRRPGTYLAIALGAGILAGRLTKGLTGSDDRQQSGPTGEGSYGYSGPTGTGYAGSGPAGTGSAGTGYAGAGAATAGYAGTTGYETGGGTTGSAGSGYGQDDALLTSGDVPAVQAVPPVEGYGTSGGQGDLTR